MALPSSRRPAYAQQLLEEESKQMKRNELKIRINLPQAVIASVGSWYTRLSKKRKRHLSPKELKRRVVGYCYNLKFEYLNLPMNWISILKEKYGLVLHTKEKPVTEAPKKKFLPYVMDDLEDEEEDDFDGKFGDGSDKAFQDELRDLMSNSQSEYTITSGTINESPAEDSSIETRAKFRQRQGNMSQSMNDSEVTHSTPKEKVDENKPKRLLDLTDELPSAKYLSLLAVGKAPLRILRLYCDKDVNVLFYDDDPTPAEWGPECSTKIRNDIGFQWWDEEIRAKKLRGELEAKYAPDSETES